LPAIDRSLLALRARDFVARFDVPPSQTGELERDFAPMWPVSAHWLPRALELLSSTDRVFAADARGARPLRVDAGTPFEFELLVADGKPGVAVVTGQFRRGDEVLQAGMVELDDGTFGLLPEQWLRRIEALRLLDGEVDGDVLRVPRSRGLMLDALLAARSDDAVEVQAIDRAHRSGHKRVVNAYRLVCRDTVEERVLELQSRKKALCEAILGNERSLRQDLTRADLELLLG
jgi:hypothetical protein